MNKIEIDRNDKYRVLLTELLPYEVPMLFSNEGYYKIISKKLHTDFLDKVKSTRQSGPYGIPFDYKISKGVDAGSRRLSIIHPMNQLRFVDFYEKYASLIEYHCKQSPFSLRKVKDIARFYFSPDFVFTDEDELKSAEVEVAREDGLQSVIYKSYFTYEPIDLVYKFYERFEYRRLEQKFTYLLVFDISKCFYNIYTHSITWAIKGKENAKSRSRKITFENSFDKIMQLANYNETNGIVVGPEVSRLFAEIILSRIDQEVKVRLLNAELIQSKDYDIRRYVDDYFIYTNDEKISKKIHKILSEELEFYKLYANDRKIEFHSTPFISKLSIGKDEIKVLTDEFFEGVLQTELYLENDEEKTRLIINSRKVSNPYSVANQFIKKFQFIVKRNDLEYDQLNKVIVRLFTKNLRKVLKKCDEEVFSKVEYGNFLLAFMNILFYAFSLGVNASSTFKVSQCIVLIIKSLGKLEFAVRENILNKLISEIDFTMSIYLTKSNPDDTNVNILNLLIALCQFEDRHSIPEKKLGSLFRINDLETPNIELNYFEIMVLLYYIGNRDGYEKLNDIIRRMILEKYHLFDPFTKSENFMLFFDAICCPFLDEHYKRNLCRKSGYASKSSSNAEVDEEISKIMACKYWFFQWDKNINLEVALKTKEWISVY